MDFATTLHDTMRTVAGREVRSLDDLTHEQQFRVADRMGVHLPQLHATVDVLGTTQFRAARARGAAATRTPLPASRPAGVHTRSPHRAFIRTTEDEWWHENGRFATLVEQLCIRAEVAFDPKDSQSTRLRKLERRLDALAAIGLAGRLPEELRRGLAETVGDCLDRDEAYTSLNRQRAAARASR